MENMQKEEGGQRQIFLKLRGQRIKLDVFVESVIKVAVDIAKANPDELSYKLDNAIAKEYKIEALASARLCSPVFWYLTQDKLVKIPTQTGYLNKVEREALIKWDGRFWKLSDKIYSLNEDMIKAMVSEIIAEHREYYRANAERFALLSELMEMKNNKVESY